MPRAIHVFRTPDRFVAGTVGQPGNRTFYLQAVHDSRVISVILEKQQVAVLAERIAALLVEINRRFGTPLPPETEVEDLSPWSPRSTPSSGWAPWASAGIPRRRPWWSSCSR